ncbi:hypothetical protein MCP1_10093 [Candidatus Terasakiella magnetica]|nr:hypothetical protein MCP1_10093 [Candidatus Terasakiella magnetica]
MSITVTAEPPYPLLIPLPPPLPGENSFQQAETAAKTLRLKLLKARLEAMRLAAVPHSPHDAISTAQEAADLAHGVRGAARDAGLPTDDPEIQAAVTTARAVINRSRLAVKPAGREDKWLDRLQDSLSDSSALDIKV